MSIQKTLEPLSFTVCHEPKPESVQEDKFLVYRFLGQTGRTYAEGNLGCTGCVFALDFYSVGAPWGDVDDIRRLLTAADYIVTIDQEIYEEDTGLHHIPMTVYTAREAYV